MILKMALQREDRCPTGYPWRELPNRVGFMSVPERLGHNSRWYQVFSDPFRMHLCTPYSLSWNVKKSYHTRCLIRSRIYVIMSSTSF